MNDATTASPSSISRRQWICLGVILLAAIGARFAQIGTYEAHFDELWHLELSTGRGSAHNELPRNVLLPDAPDVTSLSGARPIGAIWTHLDSVTHPPLYPMLLRVWRSVLGESVVAARGLSAIASVLCVLALFDVARLLHGTRAALWAAGICAIAPSQIEISQEARNYALALLWLLLAADALARIQFKGPTKLRIAALAGATAAALLTHYFTVPVLAAIGVYSLIALNGRPRRAAIGALIAGALIFLIAWGPMIPRQLEAMRVASIKGSLGEGPHNHTLMTLQRLAGLPIRQLFEPHSVIRGNLALVIVLISLSVAIYIVPCLLLALRGRRDLLLWMLWLAFCASFVLVLDLARETRHLAQLRHTIFAGPAVFAIVAAAATSARSRALADAIPAVVLGVCALAFGYTAYVGSTEDNPHFSQIGNLVATKPDDRAPVVFYSDPNLRWRADLMYMGTAHYSKTFPRPAVRLDSAATPALIAELRKCGPRVWLVRGPGMLAPQEILPGAHVISAWEEPTLGQMFLMQWK